MYRCMVLLLALALLGACGDEAPIGNAEGELIVVRDPVKFPDTFIGYPTVVGVRVRNTGFTKFPLRVSTEAPFSVQKESWTIQGGADFGLEVKFDPTNATTYAGFLNVRVGEEDFVVDLGGRGVPAPPCKPSALCRETRFHPDTGECEEWVSEDTTECSTGNECMTNERCMSGECVGVERKCDDDNICTNDACDPDRGCVNIDRSGACPAPSDPCKVAICDAEDGCGIADAVDGTPCGSVDCTTAHLCNGGECEVWPVPDGAPCPAKCGTGECQNEECVRPEGDVLDETWRYSPASGMELVFPGLADSSGALYWVECPATGLCTLVSHTKKGFARWRVPLAAVRSEIGARSVILADGLVVVAAGRTVNAYYASGPSGDEVATAEAWSRDLVDLAGEHVDGCPCTAKVVSVADGGIGELLVGVAGKDEAGQDAAIAIALETLDGDFRWGKAFAGVMDDNGPIADDAGNWYLSLLPAGASERLLYSLRPDGVERWAAPVAGTAPLATFGDRLLDGHRRVLAAGNGSELYQVPAIPDGDLPPAPLLGRDVGYVLGSSTRAGVPAVHAFRPETGSFVSSVGLFDEVPDGEAISWTSPLLTRVESALLAASRPADGGFATKMEEIGSDGEILRSCDLPGTAPYAGGATLRGGQWVVVQRPPTGPATLRSFDVIGADPAAAGWAAPFGNQSGSGRPQ